MKHGSLDSDKGCVDIESLEKIMKRRKYGGTFQNYIELVMRSFNSNQCKPIY